MRRRSRNAFTLVELMVVLLIIAILVSLVSSAAMKALGKIPEVKTATEISQLAVALEAFKMDYGLSDPPSSVLILNEYNSLSTPGDNGRSAAFLQKVFGKNLAPQQDWNGNGRIDGPPAGWVLEGEQAIVFYLGGIPQQGAPQGFSTNNMNPAALGGKRKGPYFPFDLARLKPAAGGFFVYVDPWQSKASPLYATFGGTPYAYFSSGGINNAYSLTDCAGINAAPYFVTATKQFMNPSGYQLISAGKDGVFGTTGWVPAAGATGAGADDQANFSAGLLGSGQQ